MGREIRCTAKVGRKRSEGVALLETDEILFRGEPRLRIPFRDIRKLSARAGALIVEHAGGTVAFELGVEAEKWLARIKNPKGRIDKLGVKPGARVAVIGIDDPAFDAELADRTDDVAGARPRRDTDLVFFGVGSKTALVRLARLRETIRPEGGVWVVWPKGRPELREDDIRAAALRAGLVDVKVVAFSATHSGLKLVIPVAKRR